jgi:hypothetical protein
VFTITISVDAPIATSTSTIVFHEFEATQPISLLAYNDMSQQAAATSISVFISPALPSLYAGGVPIDERFSHAQTAFSFIVSIIDDDVCAAGSLQEFVNDLGCQCVEPFQPSSTLSAGATHVAKHLLLCVCVLVCLCVWKCVCLCMRMFLGVCVSVYGCVYGSVYEGVNVCLYVCMRVCLCV